jgi:hypothetical protein
MTQKKTPARARTRALSAKPADRRPAQLFDAHGNHCLVASDGRRTIWASYRQITMLDGWVGHAAFYGLHEDVVSPKNFARLIAVAELDKMPARS